MADLVCPTCGPTAAESHPRRRGVMRCTNCKEWLTPLGPHAPNCTDPDDSHRGVCRTDRRVQPDSFSVEVINGAIWLFHPAASIALTRAQAVAVGAAGASVGAS